MADWQKDPSNGRKETRNWRKGEWINCRREKEKGVGLCFEGIHEPKWTVSIHGLTSILHPCRPLLAGSVGVRQFVIRLREQQQLPAVLGLGNPSSLFFPISLSLPVHSLAGTGSFAHSFFPLRFLVSPRERWACSCLTSSWGCVAPWEHCSDHWPLGCYRTVRDKH